MRRHGSFDDMKDDYYEVDEKNYRVIGRRRKKFIGWAIQVKVRIKNGY